MNVSDYEKEQVDASVRRLHACTFTVTHVHNNLVDPEDIDLRADMLIAAEDLLDEVVALVRNLRAKTWPTTETVSNDRNRD